MLTVKKGLITHSEIANKIQPLIEKGAMTAIHGIIVHQTGGATAQSALDSYAAGQAGAHLLIDKDGSMYQTAHLDKVTWHVGKLQARCVVELKCPAPKKWNPSGTHKAESAKAWPARYPNNKDAIGIELVGLFDSKAQQYEAVTVEQNKSLKWLIGELQVSLGLVATEVFRHPQVSYKQASEAVTANWQ